MSVILLDVNLLKYRHVHKQIPIIDNLQANL